MNEYLMVFTAVPDAELGRTIAAALLHSKLAASVQLLGPIESHYWWQDELHQITEHLCICKTTSHAYPVLSEHVRALHPYVTPELFAVPITAGTSDYLAWIARYACT